MFNLFSRKKAQVLLPYRTDLHSHLLPGIDDGSPDTGTSLQLVAQMRQWGITRIIATPHVTEDRFENTRESIEAALQQLRSRLDGEAPEILYSAEYRLDDNFIKHFRNDTLIPLPHNYLLIENSFIQPFWDLKNLVFELQLKGFKPILAHPERYAYYYENRKIYTELRQAGCLFQINWLSLAGYYGKETRNIARWMINNQLVDLAGTDLHNLHHARVITDYLNSSDYRKISTKTALKNDTLFAAE